MAESSYRPITGSRRPSSRRPSPSRRPTSASPSSFDQPDALARLEARDAIVEPPPSIYETADWPADLPTSWRAAGCDAIAS